jgi:hypothetical protein
LFKTISLRIGNYYVSDSIPLLTGRGNIRYLRFATLLACALLSLRTSKCRQTM